MSAEDTHVVIAPHLWRALEVMGRDMAVEPAQLVNQAVFAWLRINGYVMPGTVHEALAGTPAPTTGPAEAVQREAPTAAARPALVDLQARPTAPEAAPATPAAAARPAPPAVEAPRLVTPPAPVAAPAPEKTDEIAVHAPVPAAAPADAAANADAVAAVVARLGEIEADLARLARPRPAFPVEPAEDEGEDENDAADEADDDADEADDADASAAGDDADDAADDGADEADDEPGDDDAEVPSEETAAADDDGLADTSDSPDSDEEPSHAEGTVVVRQVPVVLYIERQGEDAVRVEAEHFVIGRGPTCDLIIDSARVSREHVRLSRQGARFVIEDLGSSNGTWLGEDRVERREVESGEEYSLGNELIRLVLRGE